MQGNAAHKVLMLLDGIFEKGYRSSCLDGGPVISLGTELVERMLLPAKLLSSPR